MLFFLTVRENRPYVRENRPAFCEKKFSGIGFVNLCVFLHFMGKEGERKIDLFL